MRIKLYEDAAQRYKNERGVWAQTPEARTFTEKVRQLQGQWLDVDTTFLFQDQFNTVPVKRVSENGLRIHDYMVEEIVDDAREAETYKAVDWLVEHGIPMNSLMDRVKTFGEGYEIIEEVLAANPEHGLDVTAVQWPIVVDTLRGRRWHCRPIRRHTDPDVIREKQEREREWNKLPPVRLDDELGLNPTFTFCPRCGKEMNEILMPGKAWVYECQCGARVLHSVGSGKNDCPKCGENLNGRPRRRFDGSKERWAASRPCEECQEENQQFQEIVAAGGVYWRCQEHPEHRGVFKAEAEISRKVRENMGVEAPEPCGVELDAETCPVCSK